MFRIVKTKTVLKLLSIKNNLKEKERILKQIKQFSAIGNYLDLIFLDDIASGEVKSQSLQDLKALKLLSGKKNGFYVEFGADDGIQNSNTYYLNKKFGWHGILAEPNPNRYLELKKNRSGDFISNALIWNEKDVEFEFTVAGQLSTISKFVESDFMKKDRKLATEVKVKLKTTDLETVLNNANAPKDIDFLSIDTEGSEFEILENFNFNKYIFKVICVEHNNNEEKINKLNNLLLNKGYVTDLTFSQGVDGFYVHLSCRE